MARRDKLEMEVLRDKYREKIFQPEFREKSFKEQGEELGVSGMCISNWRKEIGPERWQQILDMTRKESALPTLEVDDALLRAAKGGDVPAIKLWYEIHGWSPKQNLEISRGADKELSPEQMVQALKDALQLLPEDKRAELLLEAQGRPVLEAKSEAEGGEAGGNGKN